MSLADSFFVSTTVHARKVTLPDGSEHELHFKEIPAVDFRRYQIAEQSKDDAERAAAMPKLIAVSLCEADGKPAISEAKARQLKPAAMNALMEAIIDVNAVAKKAGKD